MDSQIQTEEYLRASELRFRQMAENIRDVFLLLDVATDFSSLSYLARLPVDTLKIDRSFVNGMTDGEQGLVLVSTIINLAHSLRLRVVAEGVETTQQSGLLRSLNCDETQGYLLSRLVPREMFEARYLTATSAA